MLLRALRARVHFEESFEQKQWTNLSCPSALLKFLDIFMYVWLAVGAHLKKSWWQCHGRVSCCCEACADMMQHGTRVRAKCLEFVTSLLHWATIAFNHFIVEPSNVKWKTINYEQSRTFLELVYWIFELAKSPQVCEIIRFWQQCVSFELGHLIFELADVL